MPSSHEERAEARTCQGGVTGRTSSFLFVILFCFLAWHTVPSGIHNALRAPNLPHQPSPTHPTYARLHGAAKQRKQRNSTGRRKTMERPCPPRVGKYCQELLLFYLLLGVEPWARAAPPTLACCRRWARTPTESGGSLSLAPCRTASFPHGASPTRASRASRSLRRSSHRSIRT